MERRNAIAAGRGWRHQEPGAAEPGQRESRTRCEASRRDYAAAPQGSLLCSDFHSVVTSSRHATYCQGARNGQH